MKKGLFLILITSILFPSCSDSSEKEYIVSWVNYDNTLLLVEKYKAGDTPIYKGDTPIKEGNNQYCYVFDGWNPDITAVSGDTIYKAKYVESIRQYTIKWFDDDNTLLLEEKYNYGEMPVYKNANPEKEGDYQYIYTFASWKPNVQNVTRDQNYVATYSSSKRQYSVVWKNYNGDILTTEFYNYGDTPSFKNTNPQKPSTNEYYYSFLGWDKEITTITGDQEYIAVFEERLGFEINYLNKKEAEILKCYMSDLETIQVPEKIENHSIVRICEYAFKDFNKTKKILLPSSLEVIERYAFYGVDVLESITLPFIGGSRGSDGSGFLSYIFGSSSYGYTLYTPNTLKEIIVSEGCNFIENNAFYGLSSIERIFIPDSIVSIGDSAFAGCSSLSFNSYDNALYLGNNENKYLVLVKPIQTSITNCIINRNCKIVLFGAFKECSQLTSISLPFVGGSSSDNNSIGYIFGTNSYKNNSSFVPTTLKTIEIISPCSNVSNYSFYDCSSLTNVIIAEGVLNIGDYAFSGCSSLEDISIPNSLNYIGIFAFDRCDLLNFAMFDNARYLGNENNEYLWLFVQNQYDVQSFTVHQNCKHLCSSSFSGCYNLASISIPEGILSIGYGAFQNCISVQYVVIPHSILYIGNYSFDNCNSLKKVFYNGSSDDWQQIKIDANNYFLLNIDKYFYSEEEPYVSGNYWHYVDGIPTVWQ